MENIRKKAEGLGLDLPDFLTEEQIKQIVDGYIDNQRILDQEKEKARSEDPLHHKIRLLINLYNGSPFEGERTAVGRQVYKLAKTHNLNIRSLFPQVKGIRELDWDFYEPPKKEKIVEEIDDSDVPEGSILKEWSVINGGEDDRIRVWIYPTHDKKYIPAIVRKWKIAGWRVVCKILHTKGGKPKPTPTKPTPETPAPYDNSDRRMSELDKKLKDGTATSEDITELAKLISKKLEREIDKEVPKPSSSGKKLPRRQQIILLALEGKYTRQEMGEMLERMGYGDKKKCLAAINGTLYAETRQGGSLHHWWTNPAGIIEAFKTKADWDRRAK